MRGSREISLVPSLHRASTDALISESRRNVELVIKIIHPPGGAPRPFTMMVNTHSDTAS